MAGLADGRDRPVPGPVLRPSRVASAVSSSLTLGRGLALAGALFALGFLTDLAILLDWLGAGFGALHEPRRGILGMLLMTMAAELAVFAFLHAVTRRRA